MALLFLMLVVVAVIAIVALSRTRAVAEMQREIIALRRRLRRLEDDVDDVMAHETPTPAVAANAETAVGPAEPDIPAATVLPARPPWFEQIDWETWIGKRALGWIAVVLLLFAVGFFLQHAFEQGWIGKTARVMLGVAAGVLLCLDGLRYHYKGWRSFSQMLTSAGIILLYLCTYAAFGYYELLPQSWAGVFLAILVAEAILLAVCYDAVAIAIMAVIGGLLTPLLLHSVHDQYVSLFLYLIILNGGVVILALWKPWRVFATLSLVGTQFVFWLWYQEHYHPEKLAAALLFQVLLFSLYQAQIVLASGWRNRAASVEDLVRLVLNTLFFVAAMYELLDPRFHAWLGTLVLLLASVHSLLAWWLLRRVPVEQLLVLTLTAVAMGLVAIVFPLEMDTHWVAVGWAVQGLALWRFGLAASSAPLRIMGVVFGALAAARLVFVDTPFAHDQPFVPLFNDYALPALAVTAAVLAAALQARNYRPQLKERDRVVAWVAGLGGLALLWMILSVETWEYFHTQIEAQARAVENWTGQQMPLYNDPWRSHGFSSGDTFKFPEAGENGRPPRFSAVVDEHGRPIEERFHEQARVLSRMAQTWLSINWTAYAALLLAIGFWKAQPAVRWAALLVFAVTLLKVVFVDMAELPALYRVASFTALALVMGAGAWFYQRLTIDGVARRS